MLWGSSGTDISWQSLAAAVWYTVIDNITAERAGTHVDMKIVQWTPR